MPDEIRIVLADDHPVVRGGIRYAIEREPGLKVVGEASDGQAALQLVADARPDVLITDIAMPLLDGFALARSVHQRFPAVKLVILSVHKEREFVDRALEHGVSGYVLKDSALAEVVDCIREVARGGKFASPAVTAQLMDRRRAAAPPGLDSLTPSELAVLRMVAAYKTSTEIGDELHISPRTVDTHRQNIAAKLGLRGKHALMKFALENRAALD